MIIRGTRRVIPLSIIICIALGIARLMAVLKSRLKSTPAAIYLYGSRYFIERSNDLKKKPQEYGSRAG
jgi:hypothetical protein